MRWTTQDELEEFLEEQPEDINAANYIKDFTAYMVDKEWEIGFTKGKAKIFRLTTRRSKKSARRFAKLSGVQAWMEKMKIYKYSVEFSPEEK